MKHKVGLVLRMALAALFVWTTLVPPLTVAAAEGDRTLYLKRTQTGETGRFTYKRKGKWDQRTLRELNVFLADWRTKEATTMDPALFDLIWSVYQEVGANQPINIVSSYRSPKTNALLRARSSGVAKNSQHMEGKAIDFFIPGVKLSLLREAIMRRQVGGIGYYPTSGSPFVHADTGSVRAWPRMTRAQLKKVFPDGRTLHVPTDGKPLSAEGRRYAEVEWKKCRTVPCNGVPINAAPATTRLAAASDTAPVPVLRPRELKGGTIAAQSERPAVQVASLGGDPDQRVVSAIDIVAPRPASRENRDLIGAAQGSAPIPAEKSRRMAVATINTAPGNNTALSALDAIGVPQPRVLMTDVITAYAGQPEPGAQEALRLIIEREASVSTPKTVTTGEPQLGKSPVHTASLGGSLKGMFDLTFDALKTPSPEPMANALADLVESRQLTSTIGQRPADLVAPEIDHVNQTLVHPVVMSSEHFAVMTEAEGYLDKDTELGPLTARISFVPADDAELFYNRFVIDAPLLVASR